ncbi:MAG: NusG domain II-containing protein [Terrisporobacter sp.]|uniref:NusG domain II-containing protein n=1 Tax=Terrisporobacter sp. TaxID=1965305 RepID=UPI002FC9538F
MKKKDFILIGVILIIIVGSFGFNYYINDKDGEKIEIYVNNKLYKTYDINEEDTLKIETDNGYNVVKIHDNGVEITEASCPDKVCVHSGFINTPSKSIVCLPNKVNIKIAGENHKDNEEDVIAN